MYYVFTLISQSMVGCKQIGININNLPLSHTCVYTLDIFGFHPEDTPNERIKFIYNKLKLAVGEQEMELH